MGLREQESGSGEQPGVLCHGAGSHPASCPCLRVRVGKCCCFRCFFLGMPLLLAKWSLGFCHHLGQPQTTGGQREKPPCHLLPPCFGAGHRLVKWHHKDAQMAKCSQQDFSDSLFAHLEIQFSYRNPQFWAISGQGFNSGWLQHVLILLEFISFIKQFCISSSVL